MGYSIVLTMISKVVMSTPMHLPKISIILMTSLMDHFGNRMCEVTVEHLTHKCTYTLMCVQAIL